MRQSLGLGLRSFLAVCLATCLAVSVAVPAAAQTGTGYTPGGPPTKQIPVSPSLPFTWQESVAAHGLVKAQWPPLDGWGVVGNMFQYRVVPSWSADPTLEVIVFPPFSGHPTKLERFLIQFPLGATHTRKEQRALVIGFHPFGLSEKSVFNGTILPEECAMREWVLVAAYGQIDTNFGNISSQLALDAVLELVKKFVQFDEQRVYTVGFSMGGGPAVNWALRHQDLESLRVAGVICHTGTLDLVRAYDKGNAETKNIMADADHFGGTPTQVPYQYERVSAFQMVGNSVDFAQAYVDNLRHVPIYLHWNIKDPNVDLATQNFAFAVYLSANGFTYKTHIVDIPLVHAWSTLPMRAALDWIDRFSLRAYPTEVRMHATDTGNWLFAEVREKTPTQHARFEIDSVNPSQNSLSLTATHDLGEIAIDLAALSLDPGAFLRLTHESGDGTGDRIVLKGYSSAPSLVLVNFAPPVSWSHDPIAKELTVDPTPAGSLGIIQIFP